MSERRDRLPLLAPEQLEAGQRDLHEAIAGGPRANGPFSVTDDQGRLLGPFNALLYAPDVGASVQRLGAALRFGGTLEPRVRELVICTVAAHWNSEYEWYAHSRVARTVGVSEAELASVRDGDVPAGLSGAEVAALGLATALLRDRVVGDDVYEPVVEHHGRSGLVEICTVVGYYQLLAGVLAAADIGAPAVEDREGS
ncbi:carboxymuconolactone decarboxylase family protein [Amycolatopsis palatopharyngis]|uniref:carboxymuconolactone decarboxylase family protein n=1 Tax=Amycolatopsis palatopharyngis TaxID=187982 RepID=UPI000E2321EE|nr:carboxymuconolactone decarboxylase family protein [Amycolatopsis palatopharyngis]